MTQRLLMNGDYAFGKSSQRTGVDYLYFSKESVIKMQKSSASASASDWLIGS